MMKLVSGKKFSSYELMITKDAFLSNSKKGGISWSHKSLALHSDSVLSDKKFHLKIIHNIHLGFIYQGNIEYLNRK